MVLPILQLRLLGGFHLQYDGAVVTAFNTARLQSVLAYLVLRDDAPQSRQHIAFQLWPDAPETHARNNLRQFLFQLRQALPEPDRFLAIDGNSVGWRRDKQQVIDVHLFREGVRKAQAAEPGSDTKAVRQWLEQALATYQGDLLPGCYEDWIRSERDELRDLYCAAHRKLIGVLEDQREYEAALLAAQTLLRLDPLDEDAYLLLLRLHTLTSDRSGARRVYQAAVETFQSELGVPPGAALRQAYERSQRVLTTAPVWRDHDTTASPPLSLIGRQSEWQTLRAAWERVEQGGAALLLLVTGEAGIGKTRLAEELFNWVQQRGQAAASTRSYAAEGRLSLAPVADWLRSQALQAYLASLDAVWLTEVSRLLPELLTDYPSLARPEPLSEYGQRQRFFEAMARAMLAAPHPLLLWIDDLQWCDSETLEWLHYLLRFAPAGALLVLGTTRSEESPPDHAIAALAGQLRSEGKLVSVDLSPLDAAETAKLASKILGSELDLAAASRLFQETEGNPLFVVETVRADMGSPVENSALAISTGRKLHSLPPRVYAVVARRLAHLSLSARQVVELGAAFGRAFTWEMLALTAREKEEGVVRALDELWQRRVIREQSPNTYDFTHDKIREVAYAEISAPQRRWLHLRIAQSLEVLNADSLDQVSAHIAAQYEQAGLFEQAVPYYQRAGLVASRVYANEDALELLKRGLALLLELPATAKRDSTELAFQFALARLYRITKGWTSPETERGVDRMLVLSEKVGDTRQRAEALYGAQSVYVVAAQLDKVENTYAEMHRLFMAVQGSPPPLFEGTMYAGARLHMGYPREARDLFERILAVRDEKQVIDLHAAQGVNYLALGHAWNAHAVWCLGYPEAALKHATLAVQLAEHYAQPFNQALATTYLATLLEFQADFDDFHAQAEKALKLTEDYRAPYYHAWARILVSFALAWQKPDNRRLMQLRDAIQSFTATRAHLRVPYYLSLLARAYHRAGRYDEGLTTIEEALGESRRNNERWWIAELHRMRGELMLAQGAEMGDVEAAFQRALEIAREQGARSLELRAATGLARLQLTHTPAADVVALLMPLYQSFGDRIETPDLRAVRALLPGMR